MTTSSRWWVGPGNGCRGSRLIPVQSANGSVAFGQYKPSESGSGYDPWALQVLEIEDGRIVEFTFFLDTERLFPLWGLPPRLDLSYSGSTSLQAHERDQRPQLVADPAQPHVAVVVPRRELQAGQRVDGHGVRSDLDDAAHGMPGAARGEQPAHAIAQSRKVVARDRAVDVEDQRGVVDRHRP